MRYIDLYMNTDQVIVKIQNFRAIKEADVTLNGITVVAGENGCGKSTLSKFLYYVFKNSNEYSKLVDEELKNKLQKYRYLLETLREDLFSAFRPEDKDGLLKEWKMYYNLNIEKNHLDQSFWNDYIDELFKRYQKISPKYYLTNRIKNILSDVLEVNTDELSLEGVVNLIKNRIHELFELAEIEKEEKDANFLKKELSRMFINSSLPQKYRITEYDSIIISDDEHSFIKSHSIQQVAYIDTPMLLGVQDSLYSHWDDLNKLLHQQSQGKRFNTHINQLIVDDILKGDTILEEVDATDKFTYQREDGVAFDLLECATGIKSFSILQMLLKNGFLNKYTLLIIDEPESHLHPQWIIEYARLIVLLNKHVGVKFFIASHNPDMVSAIKYISEKEDTDHNLNFYMAQPDKLSYQYTYTHLGTNIEPIFESFNIALDRISQYGTKNDDEQ